MLNLYSKYLSYGIIPLFLGLVLSSQNLYGRLSSLSAYDPFKVWSSRDPQGFLLDRKKLYKEGTDWWADVGYTCEISVSGFFQNADSGKPMDGGDIPVTSAVTGSNTAIGFQYVPILDLVGRTPMIPLMMSTTLADNTVLTPKGASYANDTLLQNAANVLFAGANPPLIRTMLPIENIEAVIDPYQEFGFFSFPSKYRKRGARMELLISLFGCVGLHVKGGFAEICQTPKPPINETCAMNPSPVITCAFDPTDCGRFPDMNNNNVTCYLMDEFDCIMQQIGMGNTTYQRTGLEELTTELYWRYPFALNESRESWLQILAIPYLEGGFSFSTADARNTNELFNVGLGNDKHLAAGICAGFLLDFVDTVEIGGEIGYTHFFDHEFDCYRIPNSKLQNNIFPFNTSVIVAPGRNLHYSAKLTARNFLEKLSGYFEFVAIDHAHDCIRLKEDDPAFVPDVLADKTGFKVKVANLALTYPLTPNFIAGFIWQAPISQRGAVRTTTIMFGLTGTF